MFNDGNKYNIPSYEEECILQYWLQGKTRDEIAQAFGVSRGTVSNIIAKFRNKLGHHDFDAARELGKQLRRQNMTLDNCAKVLEYSIL
jgi:DNA-binding CsgD family transcriptional regulator